MNGEGLRNRKRIPSRSMHFVNGSIKRPNTFYYAICTWLYLQAEPRRVKSNPRIKKESLINTSIESWLCNIVFLAITAMTVTPSIAWRTWSRGGGCRGSDGMTRTRLLYSVRGWWWLPLGITGAMHAGGMPKWGVRVWMGTMQEVRRAIPIRITHACEYTREYLVAEASGEALADSIDVACMSYTSTNPTNPHKPHKPHLSLSLCGTTSHDEPNQIFL